MGYWGCALVAGVVVMVARGGKRRPVGLVWRFCLVRRGLGATVSMASIHVFVIVLRLLCLPIWLCITNCMFLALDYPLGLLQ